MFTHLYIAELLEPPAELCLRILVLYCALFLPSSYVSIQPFGNKYLPTS